jgi:heat shock protein HtpX
VTLQEQIRANRLRSVITIAGFFLLVAVVAAAVGIAFDLSLGIFAFAGAMLYAVFALLRSREIVGSMTGARALPPDELRQLRRLVDNVSIGAGLAATPELRVVEDPAPNAFATGLKPERSFVGITTGLLRTMPKRELEAVIAHEIAHVRNRDTYLMTMAAVFVGVIVLIADIGFRALAWGGGRRGDGGGAGVIAIVAAVVGFLLAPYAAILMRMALSRRREFLADATAAEILNDPEAMALALRRLEADPTTVRHADASVAHLWIESPTDYLETERRGELQLASWFNTHPPIRAHIAALESAGGFHLPDELPAGTPFLTTQVLDPHTQIQDAPNP